MKRIVATLIVFGLLVFNLTGCSPKANEPATPEIKPSGILITALEKEMGDVLYDMNPFEIEPSEEVPGLYFCSTTISSTDSYLISGYADENENITSVKCVNMGVKTSLLASNTEITGLLTRASNNEIRVNDISAGYCIMQVYALIDLFGGEDADIAMFDVFDVFSEGKELVVNDWTITARLVPDSELVEIMAVYE